MKIAPVSQPAPRRGFTLVELSMAVMLSMVIGGMSMMLMQQQVTHQRIVRAQDFLVKEAPLINNALTTIMARADAFRIHETLEDAVADTNAVTTGGRVLVVGFQNPDGSRQFGLISFEDDGMDSFLGYYSIDQFTPFPGAGNPDWIISRSLTDATFFIQNDVFRVRLTGAAGESITYSGTPRL
ncbi:MAG: hypothetical protein HKN82_15445 [Akkermansiaceae bacterium]|nr:hypothetical protein [Akkermansiaceae bacterium]